jgi:hypothetical protein
MMKRGFSGDYERELLHRCGFRRAKSERGGGPLQMDDDGDTGAGLPGAQIGDVVQER